MKKASSPRKNPISKVLRAPTGKQLHCRAWPQEAAFRMLQNNLDPAVAENPEELVVYGGRGKALRNPACLEKTLDLLQKLGNGESLLIQSGKPVGVLPTHPNAPRILIANSNLVGHWANWKTFHELDQKGLMMYGQMTAGSWIYIGSQGILQGTYETFMAAARKHWKSSSPSSGSGSGSKSESESESGSSTDLQGKILLTAGLGGMGGAQPLAGTFAKATVLAVEVDLRKVHRRHKEGFVHEVCKDLKEAIHRVRASQEKGEAKSFALVGNMATVIHQLLEENFIPDLLTDQTSAHDPLYGYIPEGFSLEKAQELREQNPQAYEDAAYQSMRKHVEGILLMQKKGAIAFDYGNNLRKQAYQAGCKEAFQYPGFVSEYIRPLFCRGSGPFRWVALSGDPEDIYTTDEALKNLFPHKSRLHQWLNRAQKEIPFQGLPARICWLEMGERAKAGLKFNELVAQGKVSAPIVIGRDHLDCGSVASPYRETEKMRDGSDAIADWPMLNALVNTACGATWVSLHQGGGVGMGYSQHAGQVIVADGTPSAQWKLKRVLTADPALGVLRHLDAGYEEAREMAQKHQETFHAPWL